MYEAYKVFKRLARWSARPVSDVLYKKTWHGSAFRATETTNLQCSRMQQFARLETLRLTTSILIGIQWRHHALAIADNGVAVPAPINLRLAMIGLLGVGDGGATKSFKTLEKT